MKNCRIRQLLNYFSKVDIFFTMIMFIFCFLTMYYADITITGQYGLTFIDSLFDGRILSFYENALSSGIAPEGAVYDIVTYFIFGIWSIPIWILNKLVGISALSVGSLLWFKLLPTLFLLGAAYILIKISEELGFNQKTSSFISLIFILSLSAFFPVFVAIQYDVISLFFMLLGILGFFRNENKKFLIFFAISMTIKPMTLIVLFLFIVIKNKNIIKILIQMLGGCSLMIVCKMIYSANAAYRQSCSGFLAKNVGNVFESSISGSFGNISIFVACVILIYLIAYFHKESANDKRLLIIYSFILWASFCAFGSMTSYWTVYMTPFAVVTLFIAADKQNVDRLLIVDLIYNILLILLMVMKFSWVYGGDLTYSYLILKSLCSDAISGIQGTTVAGILRHLGIEGVLPGISAVFTVCMFYIAYIALRKVNSDSELLEVDSSCTNICKYHIRFRVITIYVWILITLFALGTTVLGF